MIRGRKTFYSPNQLTTQSQTPAVVKVNIIEEYYNCSILLNPSFRILHRQIVCKSMSTNCAPLIADLFLFCYERDFMHSLSDDNQSAVIEVFISTSWYLDDLLNIDYTFFDSMVNHISELQLNKAYVSDTEASFLDLHLSTSDGFVKTKIFDEWG